jgi:AcrR family transcriptional regulator
VTPTRRERSENITSKRKQQILDAALSLFSEKGFTESSTLEIARKAGVAQGTIFHYYSTKHDLLMAVAERYVGAQSFVELIKHPPKGNTVSVMAGFLQNRLKAGFSNIEGFMILISEIQRDPRLKNYYMERVLEPLIGMASRCVESGVASKDLQPMDSDLVVRIIMGVLMGLAFLYRLEGDNGKLHSISPEVLSGDVAKVIIEGIRRKCQEDRSQ